MNIDKADAARLEPVRLDQGKDFGVSVCPQLPVRSIAPLPYPADPRASSQEHQFPVGIASLSITNTGTCPLAGSSFSPSCS